MDKHIQYWGKANRSSDRLTRNSILGWDDAAQLNCSNQLLNSTPQTNIDAMILTTTTHRPRINGGLLRQVH